MYTFSSDAKLIVVDVAKENDTYFNVPTLMSPILTLLYKAKSRLMSNSWGTASDVYDIHNYEFDKFLYEHDDFIVVFAAGNDGPDPQTIASPSSSKNVISVGSSQNTMLDPNLLQDKYWYPRKNPFHLNNTGMYAYDPEHLSIFSSRGPTADGRTKPDIVSVGEFVLSARSRSGPWNIWLYMRGTSMSTPELVRIISYMLEFLATAYQIVYPSSALIRNMLITSAEDLHRIHGVNTVINGNLTETSPVILSANDQGFGRASLNMLLKRQLAWKDRIALDTKPVSWCFTVNRSDTLSVGLVWIDPPAHIHADNVLVNDLDLQVIVNGVKNIYGNGNWNITDELNNVERVRIHVSEGDTVMLTVTYKGLLSFFPPYHKQYFTLVHSNVLKEMQCIDTEPYIPWVQCHNTTSSKPLFNVNGQCSEVCNATHVKENQECVCKKNVFCSSNSVALCRDGQLSECVTTAPKQTRRNLATLYKKAPTRSFWALVFPFFIVTIIAYVLVFFKP
jgi:hypothetical protein